MRVIKSEWSYTNNLSTTKHDLFLSINCFCGISQYICKLGLQHPDRRHLPVSNPIERRHTLNQSFHNSNDRRHLNNLPDRRHISPPLRISICENPTANEQFAHSHRRHPRGEQFFFSCTFYEEHPKVCNIFLRWNFVYD